MSNLSGFASLRVMPFFYFHIRDNERVMADEVGIILDDADAALREAAIDARDMLDDALSTGADIAHQIIEVTDSEGRPIGSVELREVIGVEVVS